MISEVENWFTYHPPVGDQAAKYEEIRKAGKDLAFVIEVLCPVSRERSKAFSKLREAIMWANASIACNGKDHEPGPG